MSVIFAIRIFLAHRFGSYGDPYELLVALWELKSI